MTTLLPLNQHDREYHSPDSMIDEGSYLPRTGFHRRRLVQHEVFLRWELIVAATDLNDGDWRPFAEAVNETTDALCALLPQLDEEKVVTLRSFLKTLGTPVDEIMNRRMNEAYDAITMGLLAGQRMGLRLGVGLATRMLLGSNTGSPVPGLPANEATALIAGAQVDDHLADRLIGWLLTGQEPEFLTVAPSTQEGGVTE